MDHLIALFIIVLLLLVFLITDSHEKFTGVNQDGATEYQQSYDLKNSQCVRDGLNANLTQYPSRFSDSNAFITHEKILTRPVHVTISYTKGNSIGDLLFDMLKEVQRSIDGPMTLEYLEVVGSPVIFKIVNRRRYAYFGPHDYEAIRAWVLSIVN